jgi:antitoxin VapB
MDITTAQLVNASGRQDVCLPPQFRFDGSEVLVRRDARTGDVILSKRSAWRAWQEYLDLRDAGQPVPDDFMADRPMNAPLSDRVPFDTER